ncbi:TPA: acyltransferase family protein [Escherichia coli]
MNIFIYNIIFLACILISLLINHLLCKRYFYEHIDFSVKRYFHIDGIRGIAALFVVLNHAVFSFNNNGFNPKVIDGLDLWIFAHAGDIGVQIFFCITGFLFTDKIIKTQNKINWVQFFMSRIKRLVPMYFLATTIVLILSLLWSNGNQKIIMTIRQAINIYGFGFMGSDIWVNGFRTYSLNAIIWTLPYEWKFYCILPVICALLNFKIMLYIAGLLTMAFAFNDLYSGQVVWTYFISGAIAAYAANKTEATSINNNKSKALEFIYFIIVCSTIIYLLNSSISGYGYERFLISSALFIFIAIVKPKFLALKPLVYLGEASYSSYLLHLIINALIIRFYSNYINLNNVNEYQYWSVVVSLVAATVFITAYAFKYVEYKFIKK